MYYIAQTNDRGTTFFLVDRRLVEHKWWTLSLDQAFAIDSMDLAKQTLSRFKKKEITVISKERAEFLEEINLTEIK